MPEERERGAFEAIRGCDHGEKTRALRTRLQGPLCRFAAATACAESSRSYHPKAQADHGVSACRTRSTAVAGYSGIEADNVNCQAANGARSQESDITDYTLIWLSDLARLSFQKTARLSCGERILKCLALFVQATSQDDENEFAG